MKVLFLGIDALDCLLLEQFSDRLPNLSAFRNEGASLRVTSTFPPDSDTAWATIVTGLNPAQHGIVHFVDPLEKSYHILNVGRDNQVLRSKTFWELTGQAGHQAHAIFPHLCYPVWPTPGVMVARSASVADVQTNVPGILNYYPNPDLLAGVRGIPERGETALAEYAQKLADLALSDARFALKLMQELDWNLFFVYLSTIDAIGHFFWGYFDPDDPGFVEGHPLQQVIPDTYRLYDEIVGRFLAAVDDNVTVIIMSDHGHGIRPFKLVSVNRVLRGGGYMAMRDLRTNPHLRLVEKAKRLGVHMVSRYGLGRTAARVLRRFPRAVQTFTRPASVNWEETVAYASDMSGVKSYSYGGIIINRSALGSRDYERVRSEIIGLLQRACVLPDGSPLLRQIIRREDLYRGPFIENYPDIVLEFKYGYGVGWAVEAPLITQAAAHNVVPGSHRGDTGTFLIRSAREIRRDTVDLRDITPTVLDLMDIAPQRPYEGASILVGEI